MSNPTEQDPLAHEPTDRLLNMISRTREAAEEEIVEKATSGVITVNVPYYYVVNMWMHLLEEVHGADILDAELAIEAEEGEEPTIEDVRIHFDVLGLSEEFVRQVPKMIEDLNLGGDA